MSRSCEFCGSDATLTREDAIAQWIGEVLRDMEPTDVPQAWGAHFEAGGIVERERQYPTGGPEVVVRRTCATCNNGWMSAMEGRAKHHLEPMIRGHQTDLHVVAQLDVAAWASKTTCALEFYEPTHVVARPEDRDLIRTERRPPHHHRIRLAYRSAYLESVLVKSLVAQSDRSSNDEPDAFATLVALGHLIIQVWGGHGADTGPGLAATGTNNGRALMIWPMIPNGTSWPPSVSIEDDDLDAFAREVLPWADDSPDLTAWRSRRMPPDPLGMKP